MDTTIGEFIAMSLAIIFVGFVAEVIGAYICKFFEWYSRLPKSTR